MNAKKCKKLRKLAHERCPNGAETRYTKAQNNNTRLVPLPNGKKITVAVTGTIRLALDCQRGMYQNFKKHKVAG